MNNFIAIVVLKKFGSMLFLAHKFIKVTKIHIVRILETEGWIVRTGFMGIGRSSCLCAENF